MFFYLGTPRNLKKTSNLKKIYNLVMNGSFSSKAMKTDIWHKKIVPAVLNYNGEQAPTIAKWKTVVKDKQIGNFFSPFNATQCNNLKRYLLFNEK